jgi:hypothetical protein
MSSSYLRCSFLLVKETSDATPLPACQRLVAIHVFCVDNFFRSCLRVLVDLEARLYVLSFDAIPWSILQAWVTLGWEFGHSETSV